jgi:hypothetical protein
MRTAIWMAFLLLVVSFGNVIIDAYRMAGFSRIDLQGRTVRTGRVC